MQGEHNRQKITDLTVLNQSQMIYSFKPSHFERKKLIQFKKKKLIQ